MILLDMTIVTELVRPPIFGLKEKRKDTINKINKICNFIKFRIGFDDGNSQHDWWGFNGFTTRQCQGPYYIDGTSFRGSESDLSYANLICDALQQKVPQGPCYKLLAGYKYHSVIRIFSSQGVQYRKLQYDPTPVDNNNNNNNKTVLIKRLPPKSLSAKNTIQTTTKYSNIKPK